MRAAKSANLAMHSRRRRRIERPLVSLLFLAAAMATVVVMLITVYIWREGWPTLAGIGFAEFILGQSWQPTHGVFGALPPLVGSLYTTLGALILGVPLGVGGALFLAEFAPPRMAELLRPVIALLAAIPSVVYGFVGLTLLVPLLQPYTAGRGVSLLAGAIVLAVMILPTIIGLSEDAIRAVPREYKEASLSLGATRWQTSWRVLLPAARSGLLAAVTLGAGRAIGETMAVMMVTGNRFLVPRSILQPGATLTGTIAMESVYASPEHMKALFSLAVILFLFIMGLNILAQFAAGRIHGGAAR